MPLHTYQIQSNFADAYELDTSGSINPHWIVWLGNRSATYARYNFLRFINIDIPNGAIINSAILTFTGYTVSASIGVPPNVSIYAEANDNPSALKFNNFDISNRRSTTAVVAWNNPIAFQVNTEHNSPSVVTIIQELINRTGWERGNAINFILDVGGAVVEGNLNKAWSYNTNLGKAVKLNINFSVPSGTIQEEGKPKQKVFLHKVHDKDGNYLATWGREVINRPDFRWTVNGGMGEMIIDLKREWKNYGENVEVKMGNIVETYIQDGDQERGKLVWSGIINRYEPLISSDGTQFIKVRATSRLIDLQFRLVKDGNDNTTVAFNTLDPTNFFKALINGASSGGFLKVGEMDDTGTSVSHTLTANTFREAFEDILKLSPQYWFWRLNADNSIDYKQANYDEVQHKLYIGKEITKIKATKSNEKLINRIYFMGGGSPNLYKTYERTTSQSEWGLREKFIKDERVTLAATASTISTRHLDDFDHPISEIEIEVVDSNIDPINGYDIERFKPGDIVQIFHPQQQSRFTEWDEADWDIDYWDWSIIYSVGQPNQIIEINYKFNKVVLKVSSKLEDVQKRIEDIKRNLDVTAKTDIPIKPT